MDSEEIEAELTQNRGLNQINSNNFEKEVNTDEAEDDDMNESINQDNDDIEDEEEDDIESSITDKNDALSNPDSPRSGNRILSGVASSAISTSNASNKISRRKNKRKNFKPRNILYGENDEEIDEHQRSNDDNEISNSEHCQDPVPLNLSGHNGNTRNTRMLLPRKILEQQLLLQRGESEPESSSTFASSPMDLSNYQQGNVDSNYNHEDEGDDETMVHGENKGRSSMQLLVDENSDEERGENNDNKRESSQSSKGLSLVRPEVLFGENNSSSVTSASPTSSPGLSQVPPASHSSPFGSAAFPPGLMPFLGVPGTTTKSLTAAGLPSSEAMKDAFQEVLKLYGVPSELAEAIAKNAQNTQGKKSNINSTFPIRNKQIKVTEI